jgi:hypothetical protein
VPLTDINKYAVIFRRASGGLLVALKAKTVPTSKACQICGDFTKGNYYEKIVVIHTILNLGIRGKLNHKSLVPIELKNMGFIPLDCEAGEKAILEVTSRMHQVRCKKSECYQEIMGYAPKELWAVNPI